MRTFVRGRVAAPILCLLAWCGPAARAGDPAADAIIRVLVRKGILTQEEAAAVMAEAERKPAPPIAPVPPAPPPPPASQPPTTVVGGYLQARAVSRRYARPSTQFYDHRARVFVRSQSSVGRLCFMMDAAPSAASLRDGWLEWFVTPTVNKVQGLNLRMGQFGKPFGLEIERPDADYELPDPAAGWLPLFPGLRDVGLNLSKGLDPATRVDAALLNGNGAGNIAYTNRDNDNYKDVLLRLTRTVRGVGTFAASAYRGRNTVAATSGAAGFTGRRNRLGLAAVFDHVAGGQLRAEYITAEEVAASCVPGAAAGTADARAWVGIYVRPIGAHNELAVRYDGYDPDTHDRYRVAGDGEVRTLGIAGIHHVSDALKLSLSWERPRVTRFDAAGSIATTRNEDTLTFRGQAAF